MRKVRSSSNICLVWDSFINNWTFTYPEAVSEKEEVIYLPTKEIPKEVIFFKTVELVGKHLPEIPWKKNEGRKKIRGYSRKMKAHKKNVVKFKDKLPEAFSNFIFDCIELFQHPPINNLN